MHTHMHLHGKKEGTMKSLACFMVELITITLTVLRSPIPRDKLMWVWRQEERQIYVTRAPTSHFSRKTALLSSILFVTCTPTPSALICIYGHLFTYISVCVYICPYTMLQTDSHLPLEISFRLILVTRIDKMLAFVIKSPFFSFHFFF